MKTLIELFDDRPLENIIATETFRPERTVFLCPPAVYADRTAQEKIRAYLRHRGVETDCVFCETSLLSAADVEKQLTDMMGKYPDCALDITGGSESALFAAGLVCADRKIPVFTYSRRRNMFFNVMNAAFAHKLECRADISVEDCFAMAGGALRQGRTDNSVLASYGAVFEDFFDVFMANRRAWTPFVTYIQHVSQTEENRFEKNVNAPWSVSDRGRTYRADVPLLEGLREIGFISGLNTVENGSVSFEFADSRTRTWMRDVGAVLELYVWYKARQAGVFTDVVTSAVVDWEGENEKDAVTNEIDVMATSGVLPVFISCKVCDIKTEALNELAILRDRFGGKMAKAVIVSAEPAGVAARRRAEELDITVIDLYDLQKGDLSERLRRIVKTEE